MMKNILIITGKSDAGKDTIATILQEINGEIVNVKFSYPMKKMLAYVYSVDVGQFEDKERRMEKVPGEDFTYADLMTRAFKHFRAIDDKMMIRKVIHNVEKNVSTGVVITDMRTPSEVEAVLNLGIPITHIALDADVPGKDADYYLEYNRATLNRSPLVTTYRLWNDKGGRDDLEDALYDITPLF